MVSVTVSICVLTVGFGILGNLARLPVSSFSDSTVQAKLSETTEEVLINVVVRPLEEVANLLSFSSLIKSSRLVILMPPLRLPLDGEDPAVDSFKLARSSAVLSAS